MMQPVIVSLVAGAAAALLFASVASGSLFSVVLFYLAPLPIMMAAIGWTHLAGLFAAIFAGALLGVLLGGFFFLAFLIGVGIPAWWLGYLTLMARPGEESASLDWYPVGSIVVWAAIVGAGSVILAVPTFGLDAESFRAGLGGAFERIIRLQTQTPSGTPLQVPGLSDSQRLIDFLVLAIPPTAAVLATGTNLVNLWLAARIVNISGRLRRPWPRLPAMTFPAYAPIILAVSIGASFLPDLVGIVAGISAASMLMAYAILGLAVLHTITTGLRGRIFILGGTYGSIAVLGWPILIMTLLGLADTIINLRGRLAKKSGPPATHV